MTSLTAVREMALQPKQVNDGSIQLLGKSMTFTMTNRALKALGKRRQPLWVEMVLYFSCLVRKQLRFYNQIPSHQNIMGPLEISDHLNLLFRPVVTEHCSITDVVDKPDLNTMPVENPSKMVPKWLNLDYRSGQWCGEFGY